jgi:hypothetical protein
LTDGIDGFKVGEFELRLVDFGSCGIQEIGVMALRGRYDDEDKAAAGAPEPDFWELDF